MAPFSDIVASAYFNFALLAFGFGWLVFVGQPEKGVQRHPSLTLIGWVVASAFLIAVLATSGYGYFEIRVHESAVELLKSKKPERKLTENQITGIGSKICTQAHKIGPLIVFSVDDPEALQFAKSILFETAKCAMVNNPWHPKNITIPPIGHSTSTKETSLEVVVRDKNHPDAKSTALFIGMTEAGFDVKYGQWEDDPFLDIPTVFVYQQ